jgi:hypothetical protein
MAQIQFLSNFSHRYSLVETRGTNLQSISLQGGLYALICSIEGTTLTTNVKGHGEAQEMADFQTNCHLNGESDGSHALQPL